MRVKFATHDEIEAAQEGFWTKLQHTFTKDSKSPEIVKGLIESLSKLDSKAKLKFERKEIDFACPRADIMLAASRFVSIVTKFMVDNFDDIKKAEIESKNARDIYKKLNNKLSSIKRELDRFRPEFSILIDDQEQALAKRICFKGRTYSAMGFTVQRTIDLAKQFVKEASGNLETLRKSTWGNLDKAHVEISKHGIIGEFSKFYDYSAVAMKLYKKIDYFLFYTSKVVDKLG